MSFKPMDEETRQAFEALPVGLRETILQSGASFDTVEELRTLAEEYQPQAQN